MSCTESEVDILAESEDLYSLLGVQDCSSPRLEGRQGSQAPEKLVSSTTACKCAAAGVAC